MNKHALHIILLLAVIMIAFVSLSCRHPSRNKRPEAIIQFDDTILDLGDIPLHEPYKFEYKYTNVGDGPLVVWDVRPDCGSCTKVVFSEDSISPGCTGVISVTFDGSDRYIAGPHELYIHVRTNTVREFNDLMFTANLVE